MLVNVKMKAKCAINGIASFLGYSVPTIYQYRSRVRSHSVLSKQEFEERILVV